MASVLNDPKLERLVARLHRQSNGQLKAMEKYFAEFSRRTKPADRQAAAKKFLKDKLVALEPKKAEFCYQLCRALNAKRIVEAGTSYGVSTLYLAAVATENLIRGNGVRSLCYWETRCSASCPNFCSSRAAG